MLFALFTTTNVFAEKPSVKNDIVTIRKNNIPLETVLSEIEKQTDYLFVYNKQNIDTKRKLSLKVVEKPVKELLADIFIKTNINYHIEGTYIVLSLNAKNENKGNEASQQKGIVIQGTVTDELGETIPGVNISVKGHQEGTLTDTEGRYSVTVPGSNSTLIFSYIGFVTQEVFVGNKAIINVRLPEDAKLLEEVVVVGYGVQKRVNLTGSVSSIDISKEAATRPLTSLSTALVGLAPGLYVRSSVNDPGSSPASLIIRGQGTLNNASPLIIVDGVETSIDNVSPHDVASISVLKDAASSAIYGSRAANGTILITTKQAESGKINISYDGYYAIQSASNKMPLVSNSVEWMELQNEAARNSNVKEPFSRENIQLWKDNQGGDPILWPNTDWMDATFRTTHTMGHNVAISGGTDRIKSYMSLNHIKTPGLVENTGYKKTGIRINTQIKATPWLLIGANISGSVADKERGSFSINDLFDNAVLAGPTVYPRHPDGRYGGPNNTEVNQSSTSSLWYVNWVDGDNRTHVFTSRFYLNFNPFEGFNINASYNYDFDVNKQTLSLRQYDRWNFQTNTITASGKLPLSAYAWNIRNTRNFEDISISYEKTVFEKLYFKAMAGASQEQFTYENNFGQRFDLFDEFLTQFDGASGIAYANGNLSDWAMRSFFGRLNLSWNDKYLLEANIRRDGSSRFTSNNRWGNFPSVSVGWRISEEPFMNKLKSKSLSNLKLRASYGSLGNNSVGNYETIPTVTSSYYVLNNSAQVGFYQSAIANTGLTWESTYVTNFGIDFGFFNNQLYGTIDVYDKLTKGILIQLPAPSVHGTASLPTQNSAEVNNRGIELSLGWQGKAKDFTYYINGNFTYNKNKVVKYKGDEYSLSGTYMIKEGLPINVQYVRRVDRIVQSQEDLDLVNKIIENAPIDPNTGQKQNPFPYGTPQLGDFLYKDLNRDGLINDDDREVYGDGMNPKFMYGLNLGFNYKNFDLSILAQGVAGLKEYFVNFYHTPNLNWSFIINKQIADGRWHEGIQGSARYPRLTMSDSRNTKESDFWVQDKSFLKIRNIQLGYTLPKNLLSCINVSKLRIYAGLENFFTFTKYDGLDPEVTGVYYPTMKQATFGVNVSF